MTEIVEELAQVILRIIASFTQWAFTLFTTNPLPFILLPVVIWVWYRYPLKRTRKHRVRLSILFGVLMTIGFTLLVPVLLSALKR